MFIELGVEEQDPRFTKYICKKWVVFKTVNQLHVSSWTLLSIANQVLELVP